MFGYDSSMSEDVTSEALDVARHAGRESAGKALDDAPDDPLLRIAWAQGFGQVDQLRDAVQQAKAQGITWRQIGDALGENPRTAETKYGSGLERMRRYRERRRAEGTDQE